MIESHRRPLLIVCPDAWDYRELSRPDVTKSAPIVFLETVLPQSLRTFDPLGFVNAISDRIEAMNIGGVFSAEDYPGSLLAAVIADRFKLPGTPLDVAVLCQHKYLSRLQQRECIPQSVPRFCLLRSKRSPCKELSYPFFVKPVKSMFQLHADVVRNDHELRQLRQNATEHLTSFSRPLSKLGRSVGINIGAGYLIAEALVTGKPLTVEGYVFNDEVTVLGIADAHYYRGTRSYKSFTYPSQLPYQIQSTVGDLVRRLMTYIGYKHGCFNIDLIFQPKGARIWLLEINTRMAAQLADLFEKVDGINTYSIAIDLARGVRPARSRKGGKYKIATSVIFRRFADAEVESLNPPAAVLSEFPDARVQVYYQRGQRLSEDIFQDTRSWVYAVVNVGGRSEEDVETRIEVASRLLDARFVPLKIRQRAKL